MQGSPVTPDPTKTLKQQSRHLLAMVEAYSAIKNATSQSSVLVQAPLVGELPVLMPAAYGHVSCRAVWVLAATTTPVTPYPSSCMDGCAAALQAPVTNASYTLLAQLLPQVQAAADNLYK